MSHHAVRLLLLALAVCISTATPLPGQRISGELVDEGSGAPIDGGMIVLLDDRGDRLMATLSDRLGRFVLRPDSPGVYVLQAERVGYRTVHSPPVTVETGQDIEIRLQTIPQPIELEGVVVRAGSRCAIRPEESAAAYRVWEEARKALASTAWSIAEGKHLFRTRHYRRDLDNRGQRVLREQEETRHILDDRPFRSTPADELAEHGFLRIVDRQITYHVPDAAVLLSEPFLDGHCFGVRRGGREHAGLVGLAFEPVRGNPIPGIRGTLWLDLETAELRYVDYRYTHSTRYRFINRVSGRVEFERIRSGAWIMRRWSLRLPRLGAANRVIGLSEEGGEVIEVIENAEGESKDIPEDGALAAQETIDSLRRQHPEFIPPPVTVPSRYATPGPVSLAEVVRAVLGTRAVANYEEGPVTVDVQSFMDAWRAAGETTEIRLEVLSEVLHDAGVSHVPAEGSYREVRVGEAVGHRMIDDMLNVRMERIDRTSDGFSARVVFASPKRGLACNRLEEVTISRTERGEAEVSDAQVVRTC